MKTTVKTAREAKAPYSGVACLLMLLFAGILVKFAAFTLSLDPVLFEQVLFNLLDNAAKYAPPITTVSIRTWRDQDSVVLQVIDEGEGIPQGDLEHIFNKFYRVQKTDQVRPGTGLGLAISRGFIEAMNGTIIAANRSDRRGAVFTITLRVSREQPQEAAA